MIHIDYIFLTIKSKNKRVVVENKKGYSSIMFTYDLMDDREEAYYSYCLYLNVLSEQEGRELQDLVENKQTRKANNYLLKHINTNLMRGPCGPIELSDRVPDEWFDGCKLAINSLEYLKLNGVYSTDLEEFDD